MKETLKRVTIPVLIFSGLIGLSFFGFSREQKEEAIRRRGNKCENCGASGVPLFAHHILPQQMGGSDSLDNLLLLCGNCHPKIDQKAIRKGNLANGYSIEEIETDFPELIGNRDKFTKALRRFRRKR